MDSQGAQGGWRGAAVHLSVTTGRGAWCATRRPSCRGCDVGPGDIAKLANAPLGEETGATRGRELALRTSEVLVQHGLGRREEGRLGRGCPRHAR